MCCKYNCRNVNTTPSGTIGYYQNKWVAFAKASNLFYYFCLFQYFRCNKNNKKKKGDGYYSNGNVVLCTDNFSEKEVLKLIEILNNKFLLEARIKKRTNKSNVVWRITISKSSLSNLKELVLPYIIIEMQYKLGITN